LFANVTAPARRVFFFFADNTAAVVNNNGGLLFDNAVKWLAPVAPSAPRFNPVALSNGLLTISWTGTGTGTLQETGSLSPPNWQPAPSQMNPQNVSTTTGSKYYRIFAP